MSDSESESSDYTSEDDVQVDLRLMCQSACPHLWLYNLVQLHLWQQAILAQARHASALLQDNPLEKLQENKGIYNQEALHDKLEEIMWEGADFLDTQATTSSADEPIQDIEDDLQRELVFYNQVIRCSSPDCQIQMRTQKNALLSISIFSEQGDIFSYYGAECSCHF